MRHRKFLKYLKSTFILVAICWLLLTLYVERKGPAKKWIFGSENGEKVLIVYDPDPFYNLDEKICKSFANALAEEHMHVTVATVAATDNMETKSFDVYIYCANTYNWRPDWSITNFVRNNTTSQNGKPVVAVTLGAGSTESSKLNFEAVLADTGATIVGSYSLWLWRPNDELKTKDSNVQVAIDKAYQWGKQIATKVN
jgi:hypothetical protein